MIVVTGLRRSGTSMMMLALKESGIKIIGKKMENEWNPLGFWEINETSRGIKHDMGDVAIKIVADGFPYSDPKVIDKVIVMYRDPKKVLESMLKGNLFLKNQTERVVHKNSVDLQRTFEVLKNIDHITVDYEEMLEFPKENMTRVCRFLGQGNAEGYKIVDPKLNHHNKDTIYKRTKNLE